MSAAENTDALRVMLARRVAELEGRVAGFERAKVLLKASYDMLKKADDSHYVISVMEETVFYDDADCDGSCLKDDIEAFLEDNP